MSQGHAHPATVGVALPVKDEDLQQHSALVFHRGSSAQAGNARTGWACIKPLDLYGKDTARGKVVWHCDIQCGKAQGATELLAMPHAAREAVAAAEQCLGLGEVAGLQCLP